ncbi:FkbM family methyltransferase [Ensifer sp. 4252]|uniref:FkbM family methyltransferase n=1 Tax=Ensifer sp. 4252 TaxID=3373915 RepID=UPI003D2142BE
MVEAGGHIGYVTLHLRRLVGETGRVVVFEPGINNLPYLRANIAPYPNIDLVEMACGDREAVVSFWIEGLSGQNNSLNKQYENFAQNRSSAYSAEEMREVEVQMTTLDSYLSQHDLKPSLLKIDVEGAEKLVLEGATDCLRDIRPLIIIEVTENAAAVSAILETNGYVIGDRDHAEWVCEPTR